MKSVDCDIYLKLEIVKTANAVFTDCGGLRQVLPCLFTRQHCGTHTSLYPLPARMHAEKDDKLYCTELKCYMAYMPILTFGVVSCII